MILRNNNLLLRAIDEKDAAVLADLINDPEIEASVVGWSFPVSLNDQKKWINDIQNSPSTSTVRYAIESDEAVVGTAIISSLDFKNGSANLNIKLIKNARGKGIATNAVKLLIKYSFFELNLHLLYANVLENNIASKALWEKLGFTLDGVLRDRVYKNGAYHNLLTYSLLRSDYHD